MPGILEHTQQLIANRAFATPEGYTALIRWSGSNPAIQDAFHASNRELARQIAILPPLMTPFSEPDSIYLLETLEMKTLGKLDRVRGEYSELTPAQNAELFSWLISGDPHAARPSFIGENDIVPVDALWAAHQRLAMRDPAAAKEFFRTVDMVTALVSEALFEQRNVDKIIHVSKGENPLGYSSTVAGSSYRAKEASELAALVENSASRLEMHYFVERDANSHNQLIITPVGDVYSAFAHAKQQSLQATMDRVASVLIQGQPLSGAAGYNNPVDELVSLHVNAARGIMYAHAYESVSRWGPAEIERDRQRHYDVLEQIRVKFFTNPEHGGILLRQIENNVVSTDPIIGEQVKKMLIDYLTKGIHYADEPLKTWPVRQKLSNGELLWNTEHLANIMYEQVPLPEALGPEAAPELQALAHLKAAAGKNSEGRVKFDEYVRELSDAGQMEGILAFMEESYGRNIPAGQSASHTEAQNPPPGAARIPARGTGMPA